MLDTGCSIRRTRDKRDGQDSQDVGAGSRLPSGETDEQESSLHMCTRKCKIF